MEEFINLFVKISFLYLIVAVGFLAGKKLKIDRSTIATLLIYIITPVIIFYGVVVAPVSNTYLLLPVVFFVTATLLSLIFYEVGKLFWKTNEKNLLSAAAGSGNTGYFGLPLVLALTGEGGLSIAVFCLLGTTLYESTRSYYILAKSHVSPRESIAMVLKLPLLYAFILGLIANRAGFVIEGDLLEVFSYFKGAYVVLGMMIVGIALAAANIRAFDLRFTLLAFIAKFVGYPALIGGFVVLDATIFNLFTQNTHTVMMLISIVPMAANTISYAMLLKTHPEKAALTVMASTIFALLYIPLFVALFLS